MYNFTVITDSNAWKETAHPIQIQFLLHQTRLELFNLACICIVITGEVDSCNNTDFIEIPPKENVLKQGNLEDHEIIVVQKKSFLCQETTHGNDRASAPKVNFG